MRDQVRLQAVSHFSLSVKGLVWGLFYVSVPSLPEALHGDGTWFDFSMTLSSRCGPVPCLPFLFCCFYMIGQDGRVLYRFAPHLTLPYPYFFIRIYLTLTPDRGPIRSAHSGWPARRFVDPPQIRLTGAYFCG